MAKNKSTKSPEKGVETTEIVRSTHKKSTPLPPIIKHIGVYLFLMIVAMLYFKPAVFDGKALEQTKLQQKEEMLTEYQQYQAAGQQINWTNQVFVGMPTAAFGVGGLNYCHQYLRGATTFFAPNKEWASLFGLMLGVYLGLLLFGVDLLIASMLALLLGLFTTNSLYIASGNADLVNSLATVPFILGAVFFAYRRNLLLGTSLVALGWSLNLAEGSMRMSYYLSFAFLGLLLLFFIEAIKGKRVAQFGKFAVAMLFAVLLGALSNIGSLWSSYEYSQVSSRGRSELTKKDYLIGYPKDYLFDLSLEKMETATLMFPDFYGGSSALRFYEKENTATKKAINDLAVQQEIMAVAKAQGFDESAFLNQVVYQYSSQYRGGQSVSEGPNYYGVVVCLLFILSLFLLQGLAKWGLVSMLLFYTLFAWGKNFGALGEFMYAYFPFYNLFEAPKMALVAMQPIVILGIGLGMKAWFDFDAKRYEGTRIAQLLSWIKQPVSRQGFVVLTGVVGISLCVFIGLYTSISSLEMASDLGVYKISPKLLAAIQEDRSALAMTTVFRTFIFIIITTLLLFFGAKELIKKQLFIVLLGLVAMVDLGLVNSNYINEKSYQDLDYKERVLETKTTKLTKANATIAADRAYYRVADYSLGAPSQNSTTACFHKNVGGNLVGRPLLHQELWTGYNFDSKDVALQKLGTFFNMLNVKYFILATGQPADNPAALGHVWFVETIKQVNDANEELEALGALAPQIDAVVQKKNAAYLNGLANISTTSDRIYLKSYHPDTMVYVSECSNERFAVFSEMYYPPEKGWSVYINDQKAAGFIKTNFLLRGMRIPAGKNTIKMVFEPQSISLGMPLEGLFSMLLMLLLIGAGYVFFRS